MFSIPNTYGITPQHRNAVLDKHLDEKLASAAACLEEALRHVNDARESITLPSEWGRTVDQEIQHGRAEYIPRQASEMVRRLRDAHDSMLAATSLAARYEIEED